MARSSETFGKKEKEKKKQHKKKEKLARKEARQKEATGGGLENMMAYVDENGVIRDTPPDPTEKKKVIKAESIEIGIPKREKEEFDPTITGVVSFFDDSKGFGFIKDDDGENYFVHVKNAYESIAQHDKVSFEKEKGPKGWVAVRVTHKQ